MFVVILKATIGDLGQEYTEALEQMKKLAFEEYGCLEFTAMMDGNERMALSLLGVRRTNKKLETKL